MEIDPNSHQDSQISGTKKVNQESSAANTNGKRFFLGRGRRSFLGHAGLFTAASVVTGVLGSSFSFKKGGNLVQAKDVVPKFVFDYQGFVNKAVQVRVQAANFLSNTPIPPHPTNGDEELYPNKIGSDSRGLPHNELGEVNLDAYKSRTRALKTQNPSDFDNIILGGTRPLVNPQGPLAISLEGFNPALVALPPPPALASAEISALAVELYWQALLRDVPYSRFQDDPLALAAIEDLNKLSGFRGPKINGLITPETLFRATADYVDPSDPSGRTVKTVVPPGTLDGPYISQFLLRNIPWGTQYILGVIRVPAVDPSNDFLTDYQEWLDIQNGVPPRRSVRFNPQRRFISTVRDLGEYSRSGGAGPYGASLLLSSPVNTSDPLIDGGIGAPLNPGNPYRAPNPSARTQVGSAATFAVGQIQGLLSLGTSRVIRAGYWQKWYVHRNLRPEAYGGLVHNNLVRNTQYPINSETLNSRALAETFSKFGTYLLPHSYPDGAPFHPAYPSGATVSSAVGVTLLKAFFDENHVIPNPVVPDPNDPTKVIPYSGPPLTVGGELNKLAWNQGIGRANGGIHWRADVAGGLVLGEEIAISLLKDERLGYNEVFNGFTFTKFDGTTVTV